PGPKARSSASISTTLRIAIEVSMAHAQPYAAAPPSATPPAGHSKLQYLADLANPTVAGRISYRRDEFIHRGPGDEEPRNACGLESTEPSWGRTPRVWSRAGIVIAELRQPNVC